MVRRILDSLEVELIFIKISQCITDACINLKKTHLVLSRPVTAKTAARKQISSTLKGQTCIEDCKKRKKILWLTERRIDQQERFSVSQSYLSSTGLGHRGCTSPLPYGFPSPPTSLAYRIKPLISFMNITHPISLYEQKHPLPLFKQHSILLIDEILKFK